MEWSTLGHLATRGETKYGEQIALVSGEKRLTYREFNRRCCKLANALISSGLEKGDRVAFICYNTNEPVEILMGAGKAGVVVLPSNRRLSVPELIKIYTRAKPKILFYDEDFKETAQEVIKSISSITMGVCIGCSEESELDSYENFIGKQSSEEPGIHIADEDIHSVYFTSGTTGLPKGVMRSHASNIAMATETLLALGADPNGPHRYLYSLPITSASFYGLAVSAFFHGGTIILEKYYDAKQIMQFVMTEKITLMTLIPTMWDMLLEEESDFTKYELTHLKRAIWGGMPISEWTAQELLNRGFPVPLTGCYGLSESPCCTYQMNPQSSRKKPKSSGRPTVSTEVRIVDPSMNDVKQGELGELLIRSPINMKAYFEDPEKTKETIVGGWLKTGDIAYMDSDGDLFVVDRSKDMIISGGENIYPAEVENVIASMANVREVAVVGVSDEKWGQSVAAFVVPEKGRNISEQEVVEYCLQHMARYKRPKHVKFVEEIPKNDMGKFLKNILLQKWNETSTIEGN